MVTAKRTASTLDFLENMSASPNKKAPMEIPLDDIHPDPDQPRTTFQAIDGMVPDDAQETLEQLAGSIAEEGLNHPISVREVADGKYEIAMGERRWRAFRLNRERGLPGFERIPAYVRNDLTGSKLRLAQLSENLQREDLTDLDIARFLKLTLEQYPELQKQELAKILRRSPQHISRILALLDPRWSNVVASGIITYASLLDQFKSLPEEAREELATKAKQEKRALTSGDIRSARDKVKNKPASSGAGVSPVTHEEDGGGETDDRNDANFSGINPDLAKSVQALIEEAAPRGETYRPSASVAKMQPQPRIVDHGGDAVIPAGAASLSESLLNKREIKMTIEQFAKLVGSDATIDKRHVVHCQLPVGELKDAIRDLGGEVPQDDSLLVITLLSLLNQA